jgi:TrkA domain protein
MEVREVDLPGVGKKFALVTREHERLTIIIHNTGAREIYNFRKGEDFPFYAVRFDDEEARKLAAILGGAYFQPAGGGSVDMLLEQLALEWVKIGSNSPLANRTISELEIRKRTGASVIAVLRGKQLLANPAPDERLAGGDTVVVAGTGPQVQRFISFERSASV